MVAGELITLLLEVKFFYLAIDRTGNISIIKNILILIDIGIPNSKIKNIGSLSGPRADCSRESQK